MTQELLNDNIWNGMNNHIRSLACQVFVTNSVWKRECLFDTFPIKIIICDFTQNQGQKDSDRAENNTLSLLIL